MIVDMFLTVKSVILSVVVGVFAVCSACNYKTDVPIEFPTPPPSPGATPLAKLGLKPDAELEKQFAKIAEEAKGKVGAMAVVLETGESASLNADQRFPMQSVYKLPIAMAVMEQVRLDKIDLDEKVAVTKDDFVRAGMRSPLRDENPNGGEFTIRELIRLSIVESDGTASDVLLRLVPLTDVQSYLTQIGVRDMKVVNTEKEIGRDWQTQYENWATPAASVELLRWLDASVDSWKPPNLEENLIDNKLLLQLMMFSNPGPKRIKGQLPLINPLKVVAHKTGTGGTKDGITGATNDIGIAYLGDGRRIAIAVYVSDSPADERTREAVIAKIAKAAWDWWNKN